MPDLVAVQDEMLPPIMMRQLFQAAEAAKRSSVTWVEFEDAHHMDAYFVAQHVRKHDAPACCRAGCMCAVHRAGAGCQLVQGPLLGRHTSKASTGHFSG